LTADQLKCRVTYLRVTPENTTRVGTQAPIRPFI
jgi:hypothetical protein